MKRAFSIGLALLVVAFVVGCGAWDSITGEDDSYVKLDGETGASCTVNSDCRSNLCVYPGICD